MTNEPTHYWPFGELGTVEPAREVGELEYQIQNQSFATEPIFFDPKREGDVSPKATKPKMTDEEMGMATARSLGE